MKPTKKIFALVAVLSFCFYIILLLPIPSWAACTGSSPNWSTTADYTSVNTCVSRAKAGDTITVAGNATWTGNTLIPTRGVNLIGSGNPVITRKGRAISWVPSSAAQTAHDTLKIQGFIIDGNEASAGDCGSAGLINVFSGTANYVNLVVYNNTIKNTAARGLYLSGSVWGVAAKNTFDRIGIPYTTQNGDYVAWNTFTPTFGDPLAKVFYFEDNLIKFTSVDTGQHGWVETGQGGSIVSRYNEWNQANVPATSLWDEHGLQPMVVSPGFTCTGYCGTASCTPSDVGAYDSKAPTCQQHSTQNSEFYGNKVYNVVGATLWNGQRGGQMLMFNNTYSAASGTTSIKYAQYSCDMCLDPDAAVNYAMTFQNSGDTIIKSSHGLANGTRVVIHTVNLSGTITGGAGNKTTITDTSKDFVALGVMANYYGDRVSNNTTGESRSVSSITTTTNANDTLNFTATTANNVDGNTYSVPASYGEVNHSGILTGTIYYVVNAAINTFQLATTLGGSPIEITGDGSGSYYKFYSEHVQNTYLWNNFQGASRINMTKGLDHCGDCGNGVPIAENVDFFNYNASFDGTVGVGAGTLASRPATCTTGVGYWATNQSTADLTGMVGISPATPISGTLYKCTAPNTWTIYYTPYTYPHPLTKPSPPWNR